MNRTMVRALAASGAAVAMVAAGALPSTARTVVDRVPGEYGGIFYDNVATATGQPDLILFADASPEDRCNRTPVSFENRVRAFGEEGTPGARLNLSFVKRVPLWLYHGQGQGEWSLDSHSGPRLAAYGWGANHHGSDA